MDYTFEHSAHKNSNPFEVIDHGSGREWFDVELMHRIDHEVINVCQKGLDLTKELRSESRADLYIKFNQYKQAVSSFLEFVRDNLYRLFHGLLEGHALYPDFLEFEAETKRTIERINEFLSGCERAMTSHKKLFEKAIFRIDNILVERHEQEIEFLSPLLRKVKISQICIV